MTRRIVNGVPMPSWPMRAFKGLVLLVFCAAVIVPFVGVISTSVAPNQQINKSGGLVLLPDSVNFDAYRSLAAIQMAILVISIVPILIVYPFLQRHFAKGVLTGAVKG